MSRTIAATTLAAIARIMAGEPISTVSRATGVSRATLHRRLRASGLTAPKMAQMGRPRKALPPA